MSIEEGGLGGKMKYGGLLLRATFVHAAFQGFFDSTDFQSVVDRPPVKC